MSAGTSVPSAFEDRRAPQRMKSFELPFETVEREIRRRHYGILGTISRDGRPHSASVEYAVSGAGKAFALFVVTDRRSKKARNIARNDSVSFTIPVPRMALPFVPPNSIQFQGRADIVAIADEECRQAFQASFVLRRVLKAQLSQKSETSVFVRITPDRVVHTYGVGLSLLKLMRNIESAAGWSEIPSSRLSQPDE